MFSRTKPNPNPDGNPFEFFGVFQWLRSCFFTLIFLEKRWNSGTHFDVQKYANAKSDMKMSWDFAMNERLHHRLFAPKFSSAHAVHSFFCNLLTLTYFDLFHKITTKHATNRGEQQILQSIMMILASVSFCFTIPWFTTRKQAWFQCFNAPQWFHLRHHTVARTHTTGSNSFWRRILYFIAPAFST